MVKQSTLSRSPRLLLEGGELGVEPISRLAGSRDVVLSRALCRFRLYRAPQTLNSTQLASAARVYAEAHAPFPETGTLILRAAKGAEIWYWDKTKLEPLAPVAQASPESVWRAPAEGWCVVACTEGFEGQYWDDKSLIASTWRREPFTAAQWRAFALSVDAPTTPAPADPPEPISAPLMDGWWRGRIVRAPLSWRDAERAAISVAICGAAVAALFCGQALHSQQRAEHATANAEAIEQSLRGDRDITRALDQQRLLREYEVATAHPRVLTAVAESQEVLARFGLRASSWRANAGGLSLIVDASVSDAPVRDIVAAMEEAPHLCGALPEIAGAGRFEIRADVASSGSACGSEAAAP